MRQFTSVKDIANVQDAVKEALDIKKNPFAYKHLGENRTLFFNNTYIGCT